MFENKKTITISIVLLSTILLVLFISLIKKEYKLNLDKNYDVESHYVLEEKILADTAAKTNIKTKTISKSKKYKPMMIYINGKAIPYKNGGKNKGQAIINTHKYASTWGGAPVFSGTDNKNTHFIGHNPGLFKGVNNAKSAVITDSKGNAYYYKLTRAHQVDDYANGVKDGVNYWNRITGTGGGERVVFQLCKNSKINFIVEMKFVKKLKN